MKRRTIARNLAHPEEYAPLLAIRNQREYDAAVARLNDLVDDVGDNPRDPRYRLIDTLGVLIEAYDREQYPIPDTSGVELLKFLMEQHGLSQGQLPEIGSQGVVSEILRGKRALNVRQISALSRHFGLPEGAFFPLAEQARLLRSARGKLHWTGDLDAMRLDRRTARGRAVRNRG